MAAPPPRQSAGPAPTRGDAHPAHAREDLNTFPPVLVVRTTEAGTRPSPCRPLHAGRAVDERRLPCRQGHECSTGPAQKAGRTGRQEARGRREREEGGERNDYATFCWRHGAVNRSSPMYATPRPVCEGAPPLPVEGRSSPCSLRTCRVSRGARGAAKAGRSPWRLRQRSSATAQGMHVLPARPWPPLVRFACALQVEPLPPPPLQQPCVRTQPAAPLRVALGHF